MFLDSGTIISDETFYTQSQIMVHHYLTLCVECFVRNSKYVYAFCLIHVTLSTLKTDVRHVRDVLW